MNNPLVIISGPTATGKSSLAIEIAQKIQGEIINFDSLCFYKELSIGVAKPNEEEMSLAPHHLISIQSISDPMNAADFVPLATELIQEIHQGSKIPILVGGSGFYLRALIQGMYPAQNVDQEILTKSDALFASQGIQGFQEILNKVDPENFQKLHTNDHYRIRRAVEFYWATGISMSQAQNNFENSTPTYIEKAWSVHHIYLDLPKDEHFAIIQKRTAQMLANGFVQEVKNLLNTFTGEEKPLKSVGYKEVQAFLNGELKDLEELENLINLSTRQLAKAQRTWFKKVPKKTYHCIKEKDKIMLELKDFVAKYE